MTRTHDGRHGDECFGCRIHRVGFSASAMPTRRPEVNTIESTEKAWTKDIAAYKTLRKQGIQPVHVDGSDLLAAVANTREQIEGPAPVG